MGGFLASCIAGCAAQLVCSCVGESIKCCGRTMGNESAPKLFYSLILLFVAIVGYFLANVPQWITSKIVLEFFAFAGCTENICFGIMSTYRVSAAAAVFHGLLAILVIGVKRKGDPRAMIQNDWWVLKILVLIGIAVVFFFIPNAGFIYYGYFALGGSAVFIVLQLVLLVDFAHKWSESWIGNYEENQSRFWVVALVGSSIVLYLLSIIGSILMYVYYIQNQSTCWMNSMFISLNIVACFVFTCFSIHPKVQEKNPRSGLLQSAIVTAFCTYLVYSSILSESESMHCTTLNIDPQSPGSIGTLILGVVFTFVAIIYSAFTSSTTKLNETTSLVKENEKEKEKEKEKDKKKKPLEDGDEESAPPKVDVEDEDEPVPYNYSFFHVTFALAAMYLGMVLTNWAVVSNSESTVKVDQGMAAVWIKIISGWVTVILYTWTIIAPLLLPNRSFV